MRIDSSLDLQDRAQRVFKQLNEIWARSIMLDLNENETRRLRRLRRALDLNLKNYGESCEKYQLSSSGSTLSQMKSSESELWYSVDHAKDFMAQLGSERESSAENSVFISYAWGGESEKITDALTQACQDHGLIVVRDKKDLVFKDSIRAFMERIGRGKAVILVIGEKYGSLRFCGVAC